MTVLRNARVDTYDPTKLTEIQKRVILMTAMDYSTNDMAELLSLSYEGIRNYWKQIHTKFGTRTRAGVLAECIGRKLITESEIRNCILERTLI